MIRDDRGGTLRPEPNGCRIAAPALQPSEPFQKCNCALAVFVLEFVVQELDAVSEKIQLVTFDPAYCQCLSRSRLGGTHVVRFGGFCACLVTPDPPVRPTI